MGRKYDKHISSEERRKILYEKRALRKIAALTLTEESARKIQFNFAKHGVNTSTDASIGFQETGVVGVSSGLVARYLEDTDNSRNAQDNTINNTIKFSTILSTYFFSTSESNEKTIEFLHKSFKEYLVAEYYIESLLDGKLHYLSIGYPSYEILSFFEDLLKISYSISKIEENNDFIEPFLNSFTFIGNSNLFYKRIIDNCNVLIKKPLIVINKEIKDVTTFRETNAQLDFVGQTLNIRFEENFEGLWEKYMITEVSILLSWISRWIALYCVSTLIFLKGQRGQNLSSPLFDTFIRISSGIMQSSNLKRLKNLNLSKADLVAADLC
jgi:hypothetical protein